MPMYAPLTRSQDSKPCSDFFTPRPNKASMYECIDKHDLFFYTINFCDLLFLETYFILTTLIFYMCVCLYVRARVCVCVLLKIDISSFTSSLTVIRVLKLEILTGPDSLSRRFGFFGLKISDQFNIQEGDRKLK